MKTLKDNETAEGGFYTKQYCQQCYKEGVRTNVKIDFMTFLMNLDDIDNILCPDCRAKANN